MHKFRVPFQRNKDLQSELIMRVVLTADSHFRFLGHDLVEQRIGIAGLYEVNVGEDKEGELEEEDIFGR